MKDELIKLFLSHIKEYDMRCFYSYYSTVINLNNMPIDQVSPIWFAEIMAERCLEIFQDGSPRK